MLELKAKFEPCAICHEGVGRFSIIKDGMVYYVCGGCFIRREDHLKLTGKDLLCTEQKGNDHGEHEST